MTSYNLSENYTDNLEALLRKSRSGTASSSTTPPASEPVTPTPSTTTTMAKSLHDYFTPYGGIDPLYPHGYTWAAPLEVAQPAR